METIGRLARRFGLSRAALLHYAKIGLLDASERSKSGYRLYTEQDAARLERIRIYRQAGLPLARIAALLDSEDGAPAQVLTARLDEINADIARLREQQRFILGILQTPEARRKVLMTREAWTGILEAAGFTEQDMARWHAGFERSEPERHQQFLEFLCIPADEVAAIRAWSRRCARR
ncbi:MerR family transcriptional regulator [Desulfocurvus vexinensis]|uniref:MerR family transcriptional regulator n=1 Tax=Desulfocurvus vexinensis TaxID=399548 RepID=UPI0004BCDB18|nr:MerR family transcriptional regulator [Desulfocurvus vexinensis]